jgi:hypothetical protein
MLRRSVIAVAVAAGLLSFACSGSDSSPTGPSGPGGSGGNFNIRITDSPYGSAKAVLVTFSDVSVHKDGNWTKVPFSGGGSTRTCDLKKLQNSAQDILGAASLGQGAYTMVRLTVQGAKIFFDNSAVSSTPCAPSIAEPAGAAFPLTIPSGEVRLNGSFNISSAVTTMLVDFDGESSINQTGNNAYMMNPVIRIVSVQ